MLAMQTRCLMKNKGLNLKIGHGAKLLTASSPPPIRGFAIKRKVPVSQIKYITVLNKNENSGPLHMLPFVLLLTGNGATYKQVVKHKIRS